MLFMNNRLHVEDGCSFRVLKGMWKCLKPEFLSLGQQRMAYLLEKHSQTVWKSIRKPPSASLLHDLSKY